MDKFTIIPCIKNDKEEHNYDGYVVGLCSNNNPNFVIFFPIAEECAHMVNFLINPKEEKTVDIKTLAVYKTMTDTWKASGRFLSGIVMDVEDEKEGRESAISVKLYLSDTSSGKLEAIIPVNFLHSTIISVMEQTPLIITDTLMKNIIPDETKDNDADTNNVEKKVKSKKKYPKDKNIIDIAKKIMSGKIK